MKFLIPFVVALAMTLCTTAAAQRASNYPHPPEAADKSSNDAGTPGSVPPVKMDRLQLQREARELLELSQSIQPDIEYVNRGLLPKDMIEKLKRIKKLSKHLRSQLAP